MNRPEFKKWVQDFLHAKTEIMSIELSRAYLGLLISEQSGTPMPEALTDSFMYRMIHARASFLGMDISPPAMALVGALSKSLGDAVMYLSALATLNEPITANSMANVFPMGFLTEDELGRMWDNQKSPNCPAGNMLDDLKPLVKETA